MGVWLALGGGGAKGIAHLGVMRALQKEGVPIDGVVGTSAGSLMGAVYCQLGDADEACDRVLGFVGSERFRRIRLAFAPGDAVVRGSLQAFGELIRAETLAVELAVVDTDDGRGLETALEGAAGEPSDASAATVLDLGAGRSARCLLVRA